MSKFLGLPALRTIAAVNIRMYRRDPDTQWLRRIASAFIEARQHHFTTQDGTPDWYGRSGPYRKWVGQCLDEAGVQPGDRTILLSSIRYHTSAILRATTDVTAIGMLPHSARERSVGKRVATAQHITALETAVGKVLDFHQKGSLHIMDRGNICTGCGGQWPCTTRRIISNEGLVNGE